MAAAGLVIRVPTCVGITVLLHQVSAERRLCPRLTRSIPEQDVALRKNVRLEEERFPAALMSSRTSSAGRTKAVANIDPSATLPGRKSRENYETFIPHFMTSKICHFLLQCREAKAVCSRSRSDFNGDLLGGDACDSERGRLAFWHTRAIFCRCRGQAGSPSAARGPAEPPHCGRRSLQLACEGALNTAQ